ncbi:MAG: HAD family hydrolase [Candidatus Marinimicrobia bacterium]|nr:HAD family hydrolase [Candidatus Neomarinimicrobiota bacterium]
MKKAIFLDRDGTINFDSEKYIRTLQDFRLFPYTAEALEKFYKAGFELIIITNQSGIGRGYFSEEIFHQMNHLMLGELAKRNVRILDIRFCPHLPESQCDCRKPKPSHVLQAAWDHDIDLSQSWFIGDSQKDIQTGYNARCKTALVLSGIRKIDPETIAGWGIRPDLIEMNLLTAAETIINLEKNQ